MAQKFTLDNRPTKQDFEEISFELGISEYLFVEKDWYAIQLMKNLVDVDINDCDIIFTGGTSLSKRDGLTNRFSEDLDFLLVANRDLKDISKNQLKSIRSFNKNTISDKINNLNCFKIDGTPMAMNSNKFFSYEIKYPLSQQSQILRPFIKLEYTADELLLPYETKSIQSLVSKAMNLEPELEINCVSPVEIAGNKISALAWRILTDEPDETIIRHLYDLAILKDLIMANKEDFKESAINAIGKDKTDRAKGNLADMTENQILSELLQKIGSDKYHKNYEGFALSMSYDADENKIPFDMAVKYLGEICDIM